MNSAVDQRQCYVVREGRGCILRGRFLGLSEGGGYACASRQKSRASSSVGFFFSSP